MNKDYVYDIKLDLAADSISLQITEANKVIFSTYITGLSNISTINDDVHNDILPSLSKLLDIFKR